MWVEKLDNGKYKMIERYEDYLTGKLKRVSLTMEKNTAQTRKIAQKTLNEKIEKKMRVTPKKNVTFSELVNAYQADQKKTVRPSTYKRNSSACKTLMEILGKDILIERITAGYVRGKMAATGKAPGTLNEHLTRFKALIRWGYKNDFVKSIEFLDKIEMFKDIPHKQKIQNKYLESDELKFLLEQMSVPTWKLLTEFLALSGLRPGEAIALEATDVDFKQKVIHVTKTYDANNATIGPPKTHCSIRDVYMQPELEAFCHQIQMQMLRRQLMYGLPKQKLFMFSETGKYLSYFSFNKYIKTNTLRLFGRKLTAHSLRHTHASLMFEQGISVEVITRRLGHENSKITKEIYLHVTKKLQEKDKEQLSKIKIL